MEERVLVMNADIQQLSRDLLAQADETWSDIQRQTVKIIHEATERLADNGRLRLPIMTPTIGCMICAAPARPC